MDHVISIKGQFYKGITGKWPCDGHFPVVPLLNFMVKKGALTVLYPNLHYNDIKGIHCIWVISVPKYYQPIPKRAELQPMLKWKKKICLATWICAYHFFLLKSAVNSLPASRTFKSCWCYLQTIRAQTRPGRKSAIPDLGPNSAVIISRRWKSSKARKEYRLIFQKIKMDHQSMMGWISYALVFY